jgi:hypothetical protein
MRFELALAATCLAMPATAFFATPAAAQTAAPPALVCTTGSVAMTYGGSPWLVHGCNDGHSVAIAAAAGSKAAPCTFTMLYQSDGGYQAQGRCSGNKTATDAAFNEIGNLNAAQVQALYLQTQPPAP